MSQNAVGFYWTLPVPWAGFTSLPSDINEAAKASQTIRFQREAIRQHARTQGYRLIHEEVFMEIAPDRGTDIIRGPLAKVEKVCREHGAVMLYVDFGSVQGWRSHGPMQAWTDRTRIMAEPVYAGTVMIDGKPFDPYEHFRDWRERQEEWTKGKRQRLEAALARASALKGEGLKNPAIALHLNDENIRSLSGKPWTADTVRKMLRIP